MTLHVCKHSNQLCSVIFVNFYNFFLTMTSLCRHLSVVSTGNCKLGHDCRRVCSHRRRDVTVSSRRRRRCVLGIRNQTADKGQDTCQSAAYISPARSTMSQVALDRQLTNNGVAAYFNGNQLTTKWKPGTVGRRYS